MILTKKTCDTDKNYQAIYVKAYVATIEFQIWSNVFLYYIKNDSVFFKHLLTWFCSCLLILLCATIPW